MSAAPTRSFTRVALAIIVAAVVISATLLSYSSFEATITKTVGAGAGTSTVSISTVTSTATKVTTLTTTSTESSTVTVSPNSAVVNSSVENDLELSAAIQPITSAFGQNITILATVLDVGSTTFEMNATGLVNPVYGPCAQGFTTGVSVYSGYYSSANLSQASQLLLYNPNLIYLCPTQSILHYTFQPLRGMTEISILTGYWTGSSFRPFPVGDYTVSVFDAWGQEAIGHFQVVPAQSISNSSSCSGSPPAGDCIGPFSYTFTLVVNYAGPWSLTYEGCSGIGTCGANPPIVSGSYNGTGFYSKAVTLTGPDSTGLTLCATAQKLDGSNSTLILTVTGYNETSLPYGSTSYCGGVVP